MSTIFKLFKALNANQHPTQIAFSFVLGMIMGLTPLFFAHNIITLALIFILRINLSAVIVAFIVFSGFAYLLDPVFNQIGLILLKEASLEPLFTDMYNQAIWQILHFNNSIVIGSVVVSYLLAVPAFIIFLILVKTYRKRFLTWVTKLKIVKWISRSQKAKFIAGIVE
jgi:uncharacterized protein (TIGR03546 family)